MNLTYVICNVDKLSARFINPRSPLRSKTGMRKGGKGGREWTREGRNDRRLNVGKGRTGRKGKEKKGKGKGSVQSLKVFRHLYMAIQTPALFSTREYSKHGRVYILLTRIRVRIRCYMWRRLTGCRNSGCRNNDL
jgi:hypothetical protein